MISMNDNLAQWWNELPAKLKLENEKGGELTDKPCPFCGKPRSQRSSYVRCQPCGYNWFKGDDLSRNPHITQRVDTPVE